MWKTEYIRKSSTFIGLPPISRPFGTQPEIHIIFHWTMRKHLQIYILSFVNLPTTPCNHLFFGNDTSSSPSLPQTVHSRKSKIYSLSTSDFSSRKQELGSSLYLSVFYLTFLWAGTSLASSLGPLHFTPPSPSSVSPFFFFKFDRFPVCLVKSL